MITMTVEKALRVQSAQLGYYSSIYPHRADAVEGPDVGTFAVMDRIALLMEAALNAADTFARQVPDHG